jgi:hypothetical protein
LLARCRAAGLVGLARVARRYRSAQRVEGFDRDSRQQCIGGYLLLTKRPQIDTIVSIEMGAPQREMSTQSRLEELAPLRREA